VMHLDSAQQAQLLELLRKRGESCPSCGSQELQTDGILRPYAGGEADVRLYCPIDPHPYPHSDAIWTVRLTREELLQAGIRTGL
jgi:hypothetical protein